MTLDKSARDAIGRAVARLRALFEEEFRQQARGRFGFHMEAREPLGGDGLPVALERHVESLTALSLTPRELYQRSELVGVLEYLVREGATGGEAVERLIREAAFTAVNRLLAVRVAEATGVLPEVLSRGRQSVGYRDIVRDLFPLLSGEDDEGFWTFVQVCGDELGASVPLLFDRRLPISAFVPRRPCIDSAVEIILDADATQPWREPEALGWAYQFFNSQDERAEMRAASAAPRNARELAVRNQFFTPHYVVEWLVQNTLGRRLRQAGYELDLPLFLGEVGESRPLELEDVRVLDPAVGSGHFLLGCYGLLEAAWATQGVSQADSTDRILSCLFGIEIDPRAAQVAQAVLLLRAKQAAPQGAFDPPTIVTARALPVTFEAEFSEIFSPGHMARELASDLAAALQQASELGSLLKVEEQLEQQLEQALGGQLALRAAEGPPQSAIELEEEILKELRALASAGKATPSTRMFAADAQDAIRFVEVSQQRYDIVLMNPPFGAPIPDTKGYLRSTFGHNAVDLYTAFVARGLELLRDGGFLGAITNRTGLFIRSVTQWRQSVFLPRVLAMADLGLGVLEGALVETAAFVLAESHDAQKVGQIIVDSLLREADKSGLGCPGVGVRYTPSREDIQTLPNSAFAYWAPSSIAGVFRNHPGIREAGFKVAQGLATADDFRFVRLWWEVAPATIGSAQRWTPLAKGGAYSPYFSDLALVVDWEDDGRRLKGFDRAYVRNDSLYLSPGLCWSVRTASGFSLRPLPRGSIFSHIGCHLSGDDLPGLLAWGNSRVTRYLIELQMKSGETTSSGGAARSYEVGVIASLPDAGRLPPRISDFGRSAAQRACATASASEPSRLFISWTPSTDGRYETAVMLIEGAKLVDDELARIYDLDELGQAGIRDEMGPSPAEYSLEVSLDSEELRRLWGLGIADLINEVIERRGAARYLAMKNFVADRRLELVCHHFEAHPRVVVDAVRQLGLVAAGSALEDAQRLVSYLVGTAFGRWDVRSFGKDQIPQDPWAAVPSVPLGSLCDSQGMPSGVAPPGYPIELPGDPILVDDPGHKWDLATRVREASSAVFQGHDELDAAIAAVGSPDLRAYLATGFFGHHLAQYSQSRRKAPIYWKLGISSGAWSLWLYYPDLTRNSLFAIWRAAQDKLRRTESIARDLQERGAGGTADRASRERLENLELLADELRSFAEGAEFVAESGWEPDLNDGAVLCAAPLEPLIAAQSWRQEAARRAGELKKGKYPWASVQRDYFGVES